MNLMIRDFLVDADIIQLHSSRYHDGGVARILDWVGRKCIM